MGLDQSVVFVWCGQLSNATTECTLATTECTLVYIKSIPEMRCMSLMYAHGLIWGVQMLHC